MSNTKIAFVTRNGEGINGDFGSTKMFMVVDVENGEIKNKDLRKVYENGSMDEPLPMMGSENGMLMLNVMDKSLEKHKKLARAVNDCDYVISRAMCGTAWKSISEYEMEPIITKCKTFEDAALQIHNGEIVNYKEKMH